MPRFDEFKIDRRDFLNAAAFAAGQFIVRESLKKYSLSFRGLPQSAEARSLDWIGVSEPIQPWISEVCGESVQNPQYISAPGMFIEGRHSEGRLTPELRNAAQTRDPVQLLVRSAVAYAEGQEQLGTAFADLSVSGRDSYVKFCSKKPTERDVLNSVKQFRNGHIEHLETAVDRAFHRAHLVLRALTGSVQERNELRASLGWVAVSGEDDPPHRPVNVPSAPYPQFDLSVPCAGMEIKTRLLVACRPDRCQQAREHENSLANTSLSIPDDDLIILFVHGHDSRAEECLDLTKAIHEISFRTGVGYTVLAMDLPCNGYASMFDHLQLSAAANSQRFASPVLDFLEQFIISFVNTLHERVPIKQRIVGLVGGSLGGNLGLRLGCRDRIAYPWLNYIVSWSPGSVWKSKETDFIQRLGVHAVRSRMIENETAESRQKFFSSAFGERIPPLIGHTQPQMWYRDSWTPCKALYIEGARLDRQEIYNPWFRRWHWRVALEEMISSLQDHETANAPKDAPRKCELVQSNLLLASGADDNYMFARIFDATRKMAARMKKTPGRTLFLRHTGHSIHTERPRLLAEAIAKFCPAHSR